MPRSLPSDPSLLRLTNEAKSLLKSHRRGEASACGLLRRLKQFANLSDEEILKARVRLTEVQYALALDYGFESWARLKAHVDAGTVRIPPKLISAIYNDLWGEMLSYYAHYGTPELQAETLGEIERLTPNVCDEKALVGLAFDAKTERAARELSRLRSVPGWDDAVSGVLAALVHSLRRELGARKPVPVPGNVEERVVRTIRALEMHSAGDVVDVQMEERLPGVLFTKYISLPHSPLYDGTKGAWDRDTEFQFELNFNSGLFIWLGAHVVKEFRKRGLGTQFLNAVERLAVEMGFRRFCVCGPLNGPFWTRVMGFTVAPEHQIGQHDRPLPRMLEGYKEIER